jgi:hypothetical protein
MTPTVDSVVEPGIVGPAVVGARGNKLISSARNPWKSLEITRNHEKSS